MITRDQHGEVIELHGKQLTAVEQHLRTRRQTVQARLDRVKSDLVRDCNSWPSIVRAKS